MFKSRRRAAAAVAGSDLPYCPMCQQHIRVDATTGRCALGHRAAAPSAPPADVVAAAGAQPLAGHEAPGYDYADDPYASIVYGRSEHEYTSPSEEARETWELSDTPEPADDYAGWAQSPEFSTFDDTQQLPVAGEETGIFAPLDETEAEEVDDATHARRRAVGTIGGTIAVSGAVFAAIAALPL
jgi:hypothetical protein